MLSLGLPRLRPLAALAVALLFVLGAAAAPPETMLAEPGADRIGAAGNSPSSPGDRSQDRLIDSGAATPDPLLLPVRIPDGRLGFFAEIDRCPAEHRDRIDRPPRSLV
jgi:hypothetical protein